ncbi:hypothetical protein BAU15_00605 [Enterococcus sp. JM4C]|uniref:ATP-binding cassette domain-containing protein n=1 Tax=Candidatus Enterococcus huntleyi TaxID=1857217 RepID=UPI00137AED59|nr:ABC transporter ATP-binding protein [Enterococcus sp. JM4C]KAF1299180.1 hypothetical protein BAU15_00605 [Enterococcus sp. JM4C]
MFANTLWIILGIYLIYVNSLTTGGLFLFMLLGDSLSWPFSMLPQLMNESHDQLSSYERMTEFHSEDKREKTPGNTQPYEQDSLVKITDSLISLNNIAYKYGDTAVFSNINAELDKGDWLSISGNSGAGKSTLMNLILKLYTPSDGEIKYNQALFDENNELLIGYVPQKSLLFTGTIRENLLYARASDEIIEDEELYLALEKANALNFVNQLKDGLNTMIGVGEEVQLSLGQQQRIALARAYVSQAEVFALDEFTSALDAVNEEVILEKLKQANKSVLMISHKATTVENCNKEIRLVRG